MWRRLARPRIQGRLSLRPRRRGRRLAPLVPLGPLALVQWVQLPRLGQPGLRRLLLRRQVLAPVGSAFPRAWWSAAPEHPAQAAF
ncbi:MAG: hypothetical protein ACLP7Q_14460 [Isosphaeraceae bacterium]